MHQILIYSDSLTWGNGLVQIGGRLRWRVDPRVGASDVASALLTFSPSADTRDLVGAARRRLAIDRQQMLATLVMMGINRVVVTDGKIGARLGRI